MPDVVQMLKGTAVGGITTAVLLALFRSRWLRGPSFRASIAEVLSFGAGFYAGCLVLGIQPRSFLREDQDRLLALLLPGTLAVELLIAWRKCPNITAWSLRLLVGLAIVPVLLYGTIYLSDAAGPETREWSTTTLALAIGGGATAFLAELGALAALSRRGTGIAEVAALAIVGAGAGVTIMFSGYASGGQIGLPLSAALVGILIVWLVTSGNPACEGIFTLAITGLFSLIVIGRGFGELSLPHAALLVAAAPTAWVWEMRRLRGIAPWIRAIGQVVTVAVVVAAVVIHAQRKFASAYPLSESGAAANGPPREHNQRRSTCTIRREASMAAAAASAASPP
jgi:hypothetical protein